MSPRILPALVVLAFLPLTAPAYQAPTGGLRATGSADLLLIKRKPRYYNEVWSWQFQFDNGTQATLNFSYAKLGFKDPVCGADLSIANFAKQNFTVGREYPEDRFLQQGSPLRVQIHPDIWFQGLPPASHRVRFATTKNQGFFLDMTFSQMVPGVAWGDGNFQVGEGDMTVALPIPSARVKGRLAVGKDTVDVSGWATLEHTRQSNLLGELLSESMRHFQPGANPLYLNTFREKGGNWQGYGFRWVNGKPELLNFSQVTALAATKPVPPQRIDLVSGTQKISLQRNSVLQTASILDGMEGVTRWVVKQMVGNVRISRGRSEALGANGFYQYIYVDR